MAKTNFTSIDEYILACPEGSQKYLREIRALIRSVVPEAWEKISYQIAAFELNGKNLIHYAGWKNHISIYPIPAGDEAFERDIASYADGKGTVKFPLDKPLPLKLIRKIVKLHVAENTKKTKMKAGKGKY